MGVFPSGQWGQTVNLLLSASVVRIHPRPPRTPVSNGYRSFCFICLAKGAARVDSNSSGADRRLRRKQGGEAGAALRFFQSPAKGLRKNQQTQPVQAPAVRFRQDSQRLGMSTGMTAVLWWAVQDENRNEQRQGITMIVVSCLFALQKEAW